MLATAGVNLDVEKQSLLQSTLTMQEQLKESQAALLLEQVFYFIIYMQYDVFLKVVK